MPLTQEQEDVEHDLKVEQMRADTENKYSDAYLKNEQRRWEPWKAMSAAFLAGGAIIGAITALLGYLVGSGTHSH